MLAGVNFSSALRPPAREEGMEVVKEEKEGKEEVVGADGLLRLLFIPPKDNRHETKQNLKLEQEVKV